MEKYDTKPVGNEILRNEPVYQWIDISFCMQGYTIVALE